MRTVRNSRLLKVFLFLSLLFVSVTIARADEKSQQPCTYWGSINDIKLYSPITGLTISELLSISLGAMPRDIVRDGLPWFKATRDDFLGKPREHKGLDFYGTDLIILAMADGRIETRSQENKAGYFVIIDHGHGVKTTYMHLDTPYSGPDLVKQGDTLGKTGISGNAVSPQLHLGITVDGKPIDPITPLSNNVDVKNINTIDYYRSLMPTKTEARIHLVSAYLSSDEAIHNHETSTAFNILSTIAYDWNVFQWLRSQRKTFQFIKGEK